MLLRIPPKVINVLGIVHPHIVAGGLLAFSLGTLLAILNNASFIPTNIVLGYLVILFADLSTHYSNDYFDAKANVYTCHDKMFGGSHILIDHTELHSIARSIAISLMLLSIALASASVILFGAPKELLIIAMSANLLGWFYSAPPVRLSAHGLGEIAIALGTGLLIPGTGYLVTKGRIDQLFLLLAIPFIMYGFILSLSLEAPDMEDDFKVGKRNLVVRKGRRFTFTILMALSSLATVVFLIYAVNISLITIIDLRVVAVFSFVPLATNLVGFRGMPEEKEEVNRYSTFNVAALFLFNIFMNVYLAILLL